MSIYAWHFVGDTLRDGRPVPKDGEWLEHNEPLGMWQSSLYASRIPHDALYYATGNNICLVECEGVEFEDIDKIVCSRRKIISRIDASELLWYYARMQAFSVVGYWDAPEAVLAYLETGGESLRVAARNSIPLFTKAPTFEERSRIMVWNSTNESPWEAARDSTCAMGSTTNSTELWLMYMREAKKEFNDLVFDSFEGPLLSLPLKGLQEIMNDEFCMALCGWHSS